MRSSLCSSLPQGGESLLVEAEFSAGFATATSCTTSLTTSTALAASPSLSTATASASFTSTSPWLLLAFLSLGSWLPGLPWWATLTLLTFTALPVGWTSFAITTSTSPASTSFTPAATTTSTFTSAASTLVSKSEVDVKFLLTSRSLKVDNSFLLFLFLLVLLLVDRRLLPLGINIGSLASFPQVKLGTLLLGLQFLPFVQGHLLLLLFPGQLCLQLFSSEFSGSLGLFLHGSFLLAFRVDSGVCFLTLLGHIVLKSSPVALAAASPLVFSLDSSSVVPGLPVIVPLSTPATTLSASTATAATTSFSSTATTAHLASAATSSAASSTFSAAIIITAVLSVALVVPLLPHLPPRASLARIHHSLALKLPVSLVLLVSLVPGVASILLHGRSLCHWLRRIFNLLGLRDLLLGLTLLEDVQRIRVLVEEESIK